MCLDAALSALCYQGGIGLSSEILESVNFSPMFQYNLVAILHSGSDWICLAAFSYRSNASSAGEGLVAKVPILRNSFFLLEYL